MNRRTLQGNRYNWEGLFVFERCGETKHMNDERCGSEEAKISSERTFFTTDRQCSTLQMISRNHVVEFDFEITRINLPTNDLRN